MFYRPWYEIEFEVCLSNSIVFCGNMWNWSIEIASSGECFKYSNRFQRTESGPMALRSFFWNFSRLIYLLWIGLLSPPIFSLSAWSQFWNVLLVPQFSLYPILILILTHCLAIVLKDFPCLSISFSSVWILRLTNCLS